MHKNKQLTKKVGLWFSLRGKKMTPKNKNNFLTNGETFGTEISLGRYDSADNWREVTPEKKAEIEKQQQAEVTA